MESNNLAIFLYQWPLGKCGELACENLLTIRRESTSKPEKVDNSAVSQGSTLKVPRASWPVKPMEPGNLGKLEQRRRDAKIPEKVVLVWESRNPLYFKKKS